MLLLIQIHSDVYMDHINRKMAIDMLVIYPSTPTVFREANPLSR